MPTKFHKRKKVKYNQIYSKPGELFQMDCGFVRRKKHSSSQQNNASNSYEPPAKITLKPYMNVSN